MKALIVLAALPAPTGVYAQQKSAESVDDYLCIFAGKCGGGEEEVTRDAPAVKGFCLGCADKKAIAATRKQPTKVATPVKRGETPGPGTRMASNGGKAAKATMSYASNTRSKGAAARQESARADLRLSFEYNSATLTGDAQARARRFAEALLRPELAQRRFVIEGHTDLRGARDYNLDLSERRARAVADYLANLGVDRGRLEVHGYGSDRPIDGRSAAAEENRRVEAVLIS